MTKRRPERSGRNNLPPRALVARAQSLSSPSFHPRVLSSPSRCDGWRALWDYSHAPSLMRGLQLPAALLASNTSLFSRLSFEHMCGNPQSHVQRPRCFYRERRYRVKHEVSKGNGGASRAVRNSATWAVGLFLTRACYITRRANAGQPIGE